MTAELERAKEEAKVGLEKMEKIREEGDKCLVDEKKLSAASAKSHLAEIQNKLDVSTQPIKRESSNHTKIIFVFILRMSCVTRHALMRNTSCP